MDSYLNIAETVLRKARRPMSAKGILASAYRFELVPTHLYGKTQHKTLQARLSEDIVARRENSVFFRTAPGKFFLREYLSDPDIPEDMRVEAPTRRRIRDLLRGPALALKEDIVTKKFVGRQFLPKFEIESFLKGSELIYEEPKYRSHDSIFIWSFVTVVRDSSILSYRLGRYRENRDPFIHKRTVGFSTLVHRDERTLFNVDDYGIVDSGVNATLVDLDIPRFTLDQNKGESSAELSCLLLVPGVNAPSDLLAVVQFHCPDWFEPLHRRLAMNDLQWLDLLRPSNNMDDFDPWSQSVLQVRKEVLTNV